MKRRFPIFHALESLRYKVCPYLKTNYNACILSQKKKKKKEKKEEEELY